MQTNLTQGKSSGISWSSFVLTVLLVVFASGCSSKFSDREDNANRTFRWAVPSDIASIDPAATSDARVLDYLRQIFESLVSLKPDGTVQANLAKSWTIDPTGMIYTFHLREGIRFSNGQRFTSHDVEFSWTRGAQNEFAGSLVPFYLGDIVGFSAFHDKKKSRLSGIECLGDHTLMVRLNKPKPSFLVKLAYPVTGIVCSSAVPFDLPMKSVSEMVGTGAFVATKYRSDLGLTLQRNPYFNRPQSSIEGIEITVVRDPATRLNLFKMGKLDLTLLQLSDVAAIKKDNSLAKCLRLTPRADLTYLQFNATTFQVLKDKRVRTALSLAIDKRWLVHEILGNIPQIAEGIVPPMVPGMDRNVSSLPFDPDRARRLLSEAGYSNGNGFPQLQIAYLDQHREHPGAEAIVTMWNRYLGIHATVRAYEAGALLEKNLHSQLAAFYTGWTGDYPDPEDYLSSLFMSTSPANGSGFKSAAIDSRLRSADSEPEPFKRSQLYGEAERLILEDLPIVPLFYVREPELLNSRVSNMEFSAFGHLSLAGVRIDSY